MHSIILLIIMHLMINAFAFDDHNHVFNNVFDDHGLQLMIIMRPPGQTSAYVL